MPTESGKPLIVISYAHTDEPEHPAEGEVKWLSFVTGYLRPAIKQGAVDLWLDRIMPGGARWEREIAQKLGACDVFILLVSRHSLSSDYVVDKEIAIIRERQAKGDAVHFYPLILTPTPKIALDLVRDKNLRPRDGKPLSDYSINERYRHMNEAADEIAEIAERIGEREETPAPPEVAMTPVAAHPQTRAGVPGWLRRVARRVVGPREVRFDGSSVDNERLLEAWLQTRPIEVSARIAVRAALRALPFVSRDAERRVGDLASATFLAAAKAWIVARYPRLSSELHGAVARAANVAAHAARAAADRGADAASNASYAAANAASAAADHTVASAASYAGRASSAAANAAGMAAFARSTFTRSPLSEEREFKHEAARLDAAAAWREISDEVSRTVDLPFLLMQLPLWQAERGQDLMYAWAQLRALLPKNQDWDVWTDWYERRLKGASRGKDYELIFASVPQEKWDKGPAAVNAWIKAHCRRRPKPRGQSRFPRRCRISTPPSPMAGAPRSGSPSSPARRTCRSIPISPARRTTAARWRPAGSAGERLLKALRRGRYNARPEYGEALEYYLDDLPKTAGAGNILLANDQIRILHAMFLADAAMLPEGFASRLKSVIANQFALNAFYDLVQRHNEAVSAGNWAQPFPLDAAKGFFGAVEDHTPRWFEREVEQGLRQVEQAEPPPAAPVEACAALRDRAAAAAARHARRAGTRGGARWRRRRMRCGRRSCKAGTCRSRRTNGVRRRTHLGEHVQPILEFLRAQEQGRG